MKKGICCFSFVLKESLLNQSLARERPAWRSSFWSRADFSITLPFCLTCFETSPYEVLLFSAIFEARSLKVPGILLGQITYLSKNNHQSKGVSTSVHCLWLYSGMLLKALINVAPVKCIFAGWKSCVNIL